jgi:hypothetical protein
MTRQSAGDGAAATRPAQPCGHKPETQRPKPGDSTARRAGSKEYPAAHGPGIGEAHVSRRKNALIDLRRSGSNFISVYW